MAQLASQPGIDGSEPDYSSLDIEDEYLEDQGEPEGEPEDGAEPEGTVEPEDAGPGASVDASDGENQPRGARAAAPAPAAETPAEDGYRPAMPSVTSSRLTDDERQRLNALALEDPVSVFEELVERRLREERALQSVSGYHMQRLESEMPEFTARHRSTIESALNMLPPEQRATKEAATYAAIFAIGEEAGKTGDLLKTLKRAVADMERHRGASSAPPAPARPAAAAPPRTPTPAAAPGAVRGSGQAGSRSQNAAKKLAAAWGLPRGVVEGLADEL